VRRINVAGISGSGKSTLGQHLARTLGVPYVELDALFHGPGWTEPTDEEFKETIRAAIDGHDGWVIDGNYHSRVGDLVLDQAELLVWLDFPLRTCIPRLVRRTLKRLRTKEDLWGSGNRERLWTAFFMPNSLLHWTIKSYFRHQREWPERFARQPDLEVVRLRSPRETAAWVEQFERAHSPSQ
jgi:adenylate kinase family enzyme